MAKSTFTPDDDALLAELGIEIEHKKAASYTAREERIIAGFEEIERFVDQHGRWPQHGEDKDIFERLYAVRLGRIRASAECRAVLQERDRLGLLDTAPDVEEDLNDAALLAALEVDAKAQDNITHLTHVKPRATRQTPDQVAQRIPCADFALFKPLFMQVQQELAAGIRQSRRFQKDASILKGEFFILGGQMTYVAEVGAPVKAPNGGTDARLRVIYDNATESNLLRRSLQRALYKDEAGRRITDADPGPLFANTGASESGTIYVLRSLADDPAIKQHYGVLHKIGVTGGAIEKRIANAKNDPTFLLAEVEIVATYQLSNINRVKLEHLIHKFFAPARLSIEIEDRFGKPIVPREWFLVPLPAIDEAVKKIKDNTLMDYQYVVTTASLERQHT